MFSTIPSRLALPAALALSAGGAFADWKTDGGYFQLQTELGGAMPNGSGIPVFQCEAYEGSNYLPQATTVTPFAGTGIFVGKTFHALAGTGNASSHAGSVCNYLCYFAGISVGVSTIHVHSADTFFDEALDAEANSLPPTYDGLLQNHSWAAPAGASSDDTTALRRFDYLLNRDNRLAVVGMLNSPGSSIGLLAGAYHSIAVGVKSGSHNWGLTAIDGTGRMKPDIVADAVYTSYSTPSVTSAASLLLDVIQPAFPDADHPQAVKAILLAGAMKKNFPGWQRDSAAEPYDDVMGAGELSIRSSYYILAAGRHVFSDSAEAGVMGWDFNQSSSSTARRYFFTVPAGRFADTFSAVLTWHRSVTYTTTNPPGPDPVDYAFSSSLPNLSLKIFASTAFVPAASPIDQSISTVDNVEHLFLRHLPPGQYMIEITSDTSNHDYALAWEARLGSGPSVSSSLDAGGNVLINAANLDPFVTYTIEKSPSLSPGSWTDATTFRTAVTTPAFTKTWQDPDSPYPAARFYRLRWASVR